MGYRGPDAGRIRAQSTDNILRYAGQTAVWRQYVSASAGVLAAGLGNTYYYREQVITALFTRVTEPEQATPGGMIADARFSMAAQQQIGRNDRLVWQGVNYRLDSDPAPSRIDGYWMAEVVRADT